MPRTQASIEKIRAELAWVNETPDPNKCGCRNFRCCAETGHMPDAYTGAVATSFWTFRWSTTVRHAASMDAVKVSLAAI